MTAAIPIDSLELLPDNHLAALLAILDNPDLLDEAGRPSPFVAEIVAPVRAEIVRRAEGRASSAATVTIETVADLDVRLLDPLAKVYDSLADLYARHPHLSDFPRAIAAMLRQEQASRRARADGYAYLQ